MTASRAPAPAARPAPRCLAAGRWSAPTAPRGREVRLGVGGRGGPWAALAQPDPSHLFAFPRKTLRALRRWVFRGPPGAEGSRASLRPLPVSRERGSQRRGELRPHVWPVPALPVQHNGRALREVSAGLLRERAGSRPCREVCTYVWPWGLALLPWVPLQPKSCQQWRQRVERACPAGLGAD